jgi:putative PEP-CTERM system TPR-repeat lipoprotein
MDYPHHVRGAATALAFAWITAGCSGGSPEQMLAAARSAADKREFRTAVIEIKGALQQKPDWPEARFLLGKTLLDAEEPVGAAVELRKALDLRHPREQAVPLLVRAMTLQGQGKVAVSEFGQQTFEDPNAHAALKSALGWAYLGNRQAAQAEQAFKEALDTVPGFPPAVIAQARMLAARGSRDAALKLLDGVIADGKADADVWVAKGDLLASVHTDSDAAIEAYRKAIAIVPDNLPAHAAIAVLHLGKRNTQAATEQVAALQKVRPGHPTTRFLQAQLAHDRGEHKAAKETVLELLKTSPENPMVNQLAGSIELAMGSNEAARSHLAKAVQGAPSNPVARRLLANAYVRAGEPDKALAVLEPLLAQAAPDGLTLSLAGAAQMQSGNIDAAGELFAKAAQADPSATNQTAVALARQAKGDAAGAIEELKKIAAADPSAVADHQLISALLRQRNYKGALEAIDGLERKVPKKAITQHLRALAQLGLRDIAQAKASFEQALSIDAAFFPSAASLAFLDASENKRQLAQQRIESVLKAQPGHLRAMLALARMKQQSGASKQEVTDLLANAARLNPTQPEGHLALIHYHIGLKQYEPALTAAQQAEAALPGNAAIVDALGQAQIAAGRSNQALTTYNRLATLRPGDVGAQMRLADAHVATKDNAAAIQDLQRAMAAKPSGAIALRLFGLLLQAGRHDDALALARDLQRRQPKHSIGWVFEGDVQSLMKKPDAAIAAYRLGTNKVAPVTAAARLHGFLLTSSKAAEADKFAQAWTKDHPDDLVFQLYLADAARSRGDLAASEAAYRRILETNPNHVVALNNLAVVLAQAKKPGGLAFAEKANGLKPNQPLLMDTLANALAGDKQIDKALVVQKRAVELAPENDNLRLGLARMYIQAGQKNQARDVLVPLEKLGDQFAGHAQVKQLLGAL